MHTDPLPRALQQVGGSGLECGLEFRRGVPRVGNRVVFYLHRVTPLALNESGIRG